MKFNFPFLISSSFLGVIVLSGVAACSTSGSKRASSSTGSQSGAALSARESDLIKGLEVYLNQAEKKLHTAIHLRQETLGEARRLLSIGLIPTVHKDAGDEFSQYRLLMNKLLLQVNRFDAMKAEAEVQLARWQTIANGKPWSDFLQAAMLRARDHRDDVNTIAEWTYNSKDQAHHLSNARRRDVEAHMLDFLTAKENEANGLAWKYHADLFKN